MLRRLLLLAVVLIALLLVALGYVAETTAAFRFETASAVPPAPVAIVFGAGVRPDGRLSRMLADRVRGGVELYQAGRVTKLLMTGDNSRVDYDEVTAMKRYAVELGVPAEDVALDYAGFSTYESCYRARPIFGVTAAVLVTQRYHLPRAVYTCRQLGVAAVGLGTPDWDRYGERVMLPYTLREIVATLNALLQVHITHPPPTFLGEFEGL
jgi:vancomycin permeability regulator SanA